ncbi:hypothetical protein WICPIJ_004983 [Wickerhamomyces pijperi]|uniref:Uncharacterized protein n=1 Tax=Wickerhamomyces pijperi TaxID=599730 RepID=A0A9P8Q6J8_WICPI|nr:hypothetical protein WICPIJ_004983 [Wickerhamomyces pijperi]
MKSLTKLKEFKALTPNDLKATTGALLKEYNLCNLSTTPNNKWFTGNLSAQYGSKTKVLPMSKPLCIPFSIALTKDWTSP